MPLPIPLPCPHLPSANGLPLKWGWPERTQKGKKKEDKGKGKRGGKKNQPNKQKENQKPTQGCSGKSEVRAEAFRQPELECLTHTVTKCKYELKPAP